MNFQELREKISIEDMQPLKINGETMTAEFVKSTILARIWRSATVNKNKRESDKGGVKATVLQAVKEGLIEKDEAFELLLLGDKNRIAELREMLPKVEKSTDPSDEDVELAIKQVLANKGQAS